MTFQAPGSFAERIAHDLAERIARGEPKACERTRKQQKVRQAFERHGARVIELTLPMPTAGALRMAVHAA